MTARRSRGSQWQRAAFNDALHHEGAGEPLHTRKCSRALHRLAARPLLPPGRSRAPVPPPGAPAVCDNAVHAGGRRHGHLLARRGYRRGGRCRRDHHRRGERRHHDHLLAPNSHRKPLMNCSTSTASSGRSLVPQCCDSQRRGRIAMTMNSRMTRACRRCIRYPARRLSRRRS
jgi:hypothetical protein